MKKSHFGTVIVGGGIVGVSTARHLAERGHSVLLVDSKALTSGSTWHAAGMLAQLKGNPILSEFVQRSVAKYSELGQDVGFHRTGSLALARTDDRWTHLRHLAAQLDELNIPYDAYEGEDSLRRLKAVHPLLQTEHFVGALHIHSDGIVNPADVTMALANEAKSLGATIMPHCKVLDFTVAAPDARDPAPAFEPRYSTASLRAVHAVKTSKGDVSCDNLVVAAGQWTRSLCSRIGGIMSIPLAPVSHQYVIFDKVPGVTNSVPVIRDYDGRIYIKPEVGGLAVGAFEDAPKRQPLSRELYEEDLDKSLDGLERAMESIPQLQSTGMKASVHGADTHSVDHLPMIGKVPGSANVFVACGFNSQGIQTGYGVGQLLSEYVLDGRPVSFESDASCLDVSRCNPQLAESEAWCQDRALEGYGKMYSLHYPDLDWDTHRDARKSSLHDQAKQLGGIFGSVPLHGWERPLWFDPTLGYSREPTESMTFDNRNSAWYHSVASEHKTCREHVIALDMSSFGKFELSGPGAQTLLQWVATADFSGAEKGKVHYTQFVNEAGGIESDLTVLPVSNESFYCISGAAAAHRDMAFLVGRAAQLGVDVAVKDVTDAYSVLAVMGPRSKALLSAVLKDLVSLEDADFPFGTWKELGFGRALRVSYVGELGWELHVPYGTAPAVLRSLQAAHAALFDEPLALGGYHAIMKSLRLEKRFVHHGHDVGSTDTPLEAGLLFVNAKLRADTPFIARSSLLRQKDEGVSKRLVSFSVDDPTVTLLGHEVIYRNGVLCGYIRSPGIGFTTNNGNAIGVGYVQTGVHGSAREVVNKKYVEAGEYEIAAGGRRVPARVSFSPLYDPKNERMRDAAVGETVPLAPQPGKFAFARPQSSGKLEARKA
ncbi:4-methylaminobutanoate oxidase (formaldehyde-forming) [Diplonema papillatum]|nr:4-methylaminobutanoate oxidase (formaldehyde-forming) [Diplonema papillatum]KAJ9459805.1 4-methylaminobutanoate oxidase (formaldehyde-forming) [Diplonema papillatum]